MMSRGKKTYWRPKKIWKKRDYKMRNNGRSREEETNMAVGSNRQDLGEGQ